MSESDGVSGYYWRAISNLDLNGAFFGYWHLLGLFSILSAVFLFFLSYLVLRAGPTQAKNRFMALMLLTEALRCATSMLFWVYAWPEEFLQVMKPARIVYYTMSFQLFILYMVAATFYSEKAWAKRISEFFRTHGLYLLPIFSFALIIGLSHVLGGASVAIGDIGWVYCDEAGVGRGTTASGEPLPFDVSCPSDYDALYPMTFSNVALGPLTQILLFIPLIGAIVAMVAIGRSQKRIKTIEDPSLLGEVKAVRLGFIGKTSLQITTTLLLFSMIGLLGEAPTLRTNPFNQAQDIPRLLILLAPLMPTAVVLAALFEGLVFTYAVVKNDMFGIDERLRKAFITATFAGLGAILFLIGTELMESVFDQGWIGGVIIGIPLIVMRRPIVSLLSQFSSVIMPESHTNEELGYLELYAMTKADGIITKSERILLDLQAKSHGLTRERMTYLENWYDSESTSSEFSLSNQYGSSGINLLSVFGKSGLVPLSIDEIRNSFADLDENNDLVLSRDEFSAAPALSSLSEQQKNEMFDMIDQNSDGVIQFTEFLKAAQMTEAELLASEE